MVEPGPARRGAGAGGHPAGGLPVDDRLRASWRRSADYGVSHDHVEPVFAGTQDQGSLFVECGREVLTDLHRTLAGEPISLMLTDADGLVLNRLSSDGALLRALDEVHLAPGFAFSEREAGTSGLGLALADRVPATVRAEQHYNDSLCDYTCAAVPVLDPVSGRLEGAVNLTTWSRSTSGLLLALAQAAASTTTALMLARTGGRSSRPAPRGEVFRVMGARLEPGSGTVAELSPAWTSAVARAAAAFSAGLVVAAVGEPGSGRATLLAQAQRRAAPQGRILSARPPAPQDVETWLSLWTPELGKPHTAVVVRDVGSLPAWAADRLRDLVTAARADPGLPAPCAVTAERWSDVPPALAGLVDTVVEVPPLRDRPDDVPVLARHAAARARGREVAITPAAERALRNHGWPGGVRELVAVVRDAASRADVVDVGQLPAEVLAGPSHRLTLLQATERDEIARVLAAPGMTMTRAADELGIGRATLYRKVAQYDLAGPRR